ncbi:LysR substrate-binding domain-containing protein [Aurantimonas endophytica]|uniref:DNA-binding transcriptional LysR family regulator n=1 Tax=Aurantimonas endophytica TaxID=1522175 RepID=A0A7W6HIP1_9HYPH|nr:LysR substrate-binding domain-containing protein [Aurantimonas endophytica]MBB4005683.1 DNA-binding transcriptional LysR family regulator [Aurantimonas endophytica]MCO6406366.1 LysR family transcriptional regulator [Aurantimonas endophytica]
MPRPDVNRFAELEVFVRVVEQAGFSAAARAAGVSASAVSKLVARLEARLGTRLVHRTTRRFQLTAEGQAFYERALTILADLEEAERAAGAGERPAGRVRVNSSASYLSHVLAPVLPAFLARYPGIDLDLVQTDQVVDLLSDRTDIAIRAGPMPSSGLMARRLGATRMTIVAAPAWIDRHGLPQTLADIEGLSRLGFSYARATSGWPLRKGDGEVTVLPSVGQVRINDGEGLRQLALAGIGPARLAAFTVRGDIAAGRLAPLLEALNPGDEEAFHAVFIGRSAGLPARARVLLDFLAEHGQVT